MKQHYEVAMIAHCDIGTRHNMTIDVTRTRNSNNQPNNVIIALFVFRVVELDWRVEGVQIMGFINV